MNQHNSGHDVSKESNVERMRLFVEQVQAKGRLELIDRSEERRVGKECVP